MRATLLFALVAVALPLAAQTPPSPPAPAKRTVELTGLVLVNGFFTNARVNNSDVPQFADSLPSASAIGGTIRQTRLGLLVTDPDVLRGSFSGEVDVDFYGGQQPSSGGRTFPLLRLRRAVGIVSWPHAQLLFGQESPLVAERSPRSLASVGTPDFATAGNLWLWLPQFRATLEQGYTLRLAEQVAVLAPTSGTAQGLFTTQPDSAERSRRPICRRGCDSRGARPTMRARSPSAGTWAGLPRPTRCSSRAPSRPTRASRSARSRSWRRRSAERRWRDWVAAGSARASGQPATPSVPRAAGVNSTSGPEGNCW